MEDKDKIIASLRVQLQDALKKISAMEQENALLEEEIRRLKRASKQARKKDAL